MHPDLSELILYVQARTFCSHAEAVVMATDLFETKGLRLGMIVAGNITREDLAEIGLLKPFEAAALAPLGAEPEPDVPVECRQLTPSPYPFVDDGEPLGHEPGEPYPVEAAAVAAPGPGADPAANAEANAEEGSYCPTSPSYKPESYQSPPKRRRSEHNG